MDEKPDNPFRRLTDRARRIVFGAFVAAQRCGKADVEPIDLLHALFFSTGSVASAALKTLGWEPLEVEANYHHEGPPPNINGSGFLRRVAGGAKRQADRLGHLYGGTEHVLLSLVHLYPEVVSDAESVRREVLAILGHWPEESDSIPTREEINVYDSLDERSACERFLGKNLDDAEQLFRSNFLKYQEDLMWMGPRAFNYYVHAALNHLRSKHASGDDVALFLTPVEFRLENCSQDLIPVARELADFCRYAIDQWPRFQEAAEPHDSKDEVVDRYTKLHQALEELA